MRIQCERGSSLIETLVALALTATVSAALLPALVLASRLHRDSAIETDAALIASARMERLAADVAAGAVATGGDLGMALAGWHELLDGGGVPTDPARGLYETRWRVASVLSPAGVYLLSVRVIPLASRAAALTLTLAVPVG